MTPAVPSPVLNAWTEERIQADNGMVLIQQRLVVEGGAIPGIFTRPRWLCPIPMQVETPQGVMRYEHRFEVQGAGDIVEAFNMLPDQIERGKQEAIAEQRKQMLKMQMGMKA